MDVDLECGIEDYARLDEDVENVLHEERFRTSLYCSIQQLTVIVIIVVVVVVVVVVAHCRC